MTSPAVALGRYVAVDNATKLPGSCYFCTGSKGPYVDTRKHAKMHGHVYICFTCLTEMAGLFKVDEVKEETPDISITSEELEEVVSGHASDIVNAARDLISYLTGAGFATLLSESVENDESSNGDGEGADRPAKQTKRTASVEGPDDVSDDSGDGARKDSPFD